MHHAEKRLLERIFNLRELGENHVERVFKLLRHGQRHIYRAADAGFAAAQAPARRRISQQVVRQQRVQIHDGEAVEPGAAIDQHFNRGLVVQDHLRFLRRLALGGLAKLDQPLCVEAVVGVAFEARRRPRQINQQTVQDGARVSAGRARIKRRVARLKQMRHLRTAQVCVAIGPVAVEKFALVAHWPALAQRAAHVVAYSRGGGG